MIQAEDFAYMAGAVRLARKGLYTTSPNPRVGCVLVRASQIQGEGYHQRVGGPHAEPNALAAAGARARGATAYVTLEPCCHQGRTPPCTDALLAAGVKRVVVAMEDPNPLVAGKGLAILRNEGVEVDVGVLGQQSRMLNPGFVKRMTTGLPYVRCKLAASLDGRTAMASGESKWITSAEARRDVQLLRARSSAIMTGIETVLADDPSLNVRLSSAEIPDHASSGAAVLQPVRVVLDSRLRMPLEARLLKLPGQTLIVCVDQDPVHAAALQTAGAQVYVASESAGRVDLAFAFRYLARQEINEVLLEAGPTLAGAALQQGLIDELVIYLAPHLMGNEGRPLLNLPGLGQMRDRIQLEITEIRAVGRDWRITARPVQEN